MFKFLKTFKVFLAFIFITSSLTPIILADDVNEILEDTNTNEILQETSSTGNDIPEINSRAAIVIDRNSNTILFGKNEKTKRKMASTTKIMTAIVVIEKSNLNEIVEVSKKSAGTGGSRLGLKTGDKITIHDLLYGLMLCSGNDAAVCLAEHVGGSIEGFAILMNNKAKELGLENTNFETPHGLDKDNHYTTAYELAMLSNYALKNKTFSQIVGTKNYTITINGYSKNLSNTNELLGNLDGIYGIKTGFTNGANRCLVTACKRGNLDIICVVLGADTKNFRTKDSVKLIEYTFKNFELVNVADLINKQFDLWKSTNLDTFYIKKGATKDIKLKIEDLKNSTIPIKRNLIPSLQVSIDCTRYLEAPIEQNFKIGSIKVCSNNDIILDTSILLDCNIDRKNTFDYLKYFIKNYSGILNSF